MVIHDSRRLPRLLQEDRCVRCVLTMSRGKAYHKNDGVGEWQMNLLMSTQGVRDGGEWQTFSCIERICHTLSNIFRYLLLSLLLSLPGKSSVVFWYCITTTTKEGREKQGGVRQSAQLLQPAVASFSLLTWNKLMLYLETPVAGETERDVQLPAATWAPRGERTFAIERLVRRGEQVRKCNRLREEKERHSPIQKDSFLCACHVFVMFKDDRMKRTTKAKMCSSSFNPL